MINLFKIMKHRKLERFLDMDAMNARPVANGKGEPKRIQVRLGRRD